MEILKNELLSNHTFYKIGGPARFVVLPETEDELIKLLSELRKTSQKYFVLGLGSNVLAPDQGYDGWVIKTLKLPASQTIVSLVRQCGALGHPEILRIVGIPGTVGGAIYMNAGTYLGEISDFTKSVRAMVGEQIKTFSKSECAFGYRKSVFQTLSGCVILSAQFEFDPSLKETPTLVQEKISEHLERRKKTQPLEFPSCGSVFANPSSDVKAWEVIDRLGLRGTKIGNAQYSDKHSNWIINLGGAKAQDVLDLIELAKKGAREKFGITLREELKILT